TIPGRLDHDPIKLDRDHGLASCLSMISSENRLPLRDHALVSCENRIGLTKLVRPLYECAEALVIVFAGNNRAGNARAAAPCAGEVTMAFVGPHSPVAPAEANRELVCYQVREHSFELHTAPRTPLSEEGHRTSQRMPQDMVITSVEFHVWKVSSVAAELDSVGQHDLARSADAKRFPRSDLISNDLLIAWRETRESGVGNLNASKAADGLA